MSEPLGPPRPQPPDGQCPKCGSVAPCVEWLKHEQWEYPPESPERVFGAHELLRIDGVEYREIYRCPVHDEFVFKGDGTPVFLFPELWVTGPSGQRLYLFAG
jgi:hypothetical protein